MPLCSAIRDRPHPETPITQSNNIVDISGVGLKQFWNLKGECDVLDVEVTRLLEMTGSCPVNRYASASARARSSQLNAR